MRRGHAVFRHAKLKILVPYTAFLGCPGYISACFGQTPVKTHTKNVGLCLVVDFMAKIVYAIGAVYNHRNVGK